MLASLSLLATPVAASADQIQDDFVWNNPSLPDPGIAMLDWDNVGTSSFQKFEECDEALVFVSCLFYSGSAAITKAESTGSFSSGDYATWTYTVPGGPDTYLEKVTISGFNVTGETVPTVENPGPPLAFVGVWDGTQFVESDSRDSTGPMQIVDYEGEPGVRQAKVGMVTDGTSFPEDHWVGLDYLTADLGDDVNPDLDADPQDLPSGWIDETPFSFPISASDSGLGLWMAGMLSVKRSPSNPWASAGLWGDVFEGDCAGTSADPCPLETPPGTEVEVRAAEIKEGWNNATVFALDKKGNLPDPLESAFGVDTIDPKVLLDGSFMSAPSMVLTAPSYTIEVEATDGESGKPNSGVVDLKVLIDDVVIDSDSQSCPVENCALDLSPTIDSDDYSNGSHQLKVKATDAVGHVKTTTVDFTVDR